MNTSTRITLEMSGKEIIMAMCDGNPGAINVLMGLYKENERIDPDSFLGAFSAITQLDELGLYGPNIWMAYKDICGESFSRLIALLRAVQLGLLPREVLIEAVINSRKHLAVTINIEEIYEAVCKELPNFNK